MMEEDVVIAIMGMTGVGKSTFIRTITGCDDIVIGHGLMSGKQRRITPRSNPLTVG
jgi:ABC-type proline/glycine betaine transport system ATPase subunit